MTQWLCEDVSQVLQRLEVPGFSATLPGVSSAAVRVSTVSHAPLPFGNSKGVVPSQWRMFPYHAVRTVLILRVGAHYDKEYSI